jgi:hypothetical protein
VINHKTESRFLCKPEALLVGSAWLDVTAQEIQRDKATIKVLEDILARVASKTTGKATRGAHEVVSWWS